MKYQIVVMSLLLCMANAYAEMITRGSVDAQGSSAAVMTISNAGIYQLSGDYAGEIVISASNATLDLQGFTVNGATRGIRITGSNVMVQNGIVRGAIIGVRIEGDNNQCVGLDLVSNGTGMEIVGNGNMIEDCTAYNNTSAGFSLVGASRNIFYACSATDNGGSGDAFGFVSHNGTANTFEECVAERTQTSGGSSIAAGFLLTSAEQRSKILNSQASNASGSNTYGIRLQTIVSTPLLSALTSATVQIGANVTDVAWQQIGSSYYVALVTNAVNQLNVRVLQFNQGSGLLSELPSATFQFGNAAFALAWQQIGGSYYLAVGGFQSSDSDVRVLQFNQGSGLLSELPSATVEIGTIVISVAWQEIEGSYYLAVGNTNDSFIPELRVLQFNPAASILTRLETATFEIGVGVTSVAWQAIGSNYYLAVGNSNIVDGPEVRVLQFNKGSGLLSEFATATFEIGVGVTSVAWQAIGSSYYLAVGNTNIVDGSEVRVLQFHPTTTTLSPLISATFDIGIGVSSVAWQQIGSSYCLAVGNSNIVGGPEVRVLQFDPTTTTLSPLISATFEIGTSALSVAWQAIGSSYYMVVGNSDIVDGPEVRVLQLDDQRFVLNNIVMNNQASGNVTGFQDDAGASNANSTNQWLGNLAANNTTNFNIGIQFPFSATKGTGDGRTDNLDASLTNGGPAEKIMATIVDQTAQASTRISQLLQNNPVFVTSATTLSTSNYYLLTQPLLASTITILNANGLTLDLNGQTVQNIVVTNSTRVNILNGFIRPTSYPTGTLTVPTVDGLVVGNSTNVNMYKLFVTGAREGVRMNNNSRRLQLNSCTANSNLNSGIWFEGATAAVADLCMANYNRLFQGFPITTSASSIQVMRCMANRNFGSNLYNLNGNGCEFRSNIAIGSRSVAGVEIAAGFVGTNIAINNCAAGNVGGNYTASMQFGNVAGSAGAATYATNVSTTN